MCVCVCVCVCVLMPYILWWTVLFKAAAQKYMCIQLSPMMGGGGGGGGLNDLFCSSCIFSSEIYVNTCYINFIARLTQIPRKYSGVSNVPRMH